MEFLRETELGRLAALTDALWDRAMAGEPSSVMALLRISDARLRLLGLTGGKPLRMQRCQQVQTVVMGPDDCRLRGCRDHS